jgi:hypothetical protein
MQNNRIFPLDWILLGYVPLRLVLLGALLSFPVSHWLKQFGISLSYLRLFFIWPTNGTVQLNSPRISALNGPGVC